MVMKLLLILFIALNCIFSLIASAREPSVDTSIEMRDILNLQRQVYQAEDRFFELYNKLNDDDLYDIHCRMHAQIGTKIKNRECIPNFYDQVTADSAQSFLNRAIHGLDENKRVEIEGSISTSTVISYHYPILKKRMKELVESNPDLYDRITELHQLTERLEEKKRIYYGRDNDFQNAQTIP